MKTVNLSFENVDMSADYTSAALKVDSMDGYSVCARWVGGGSPTGTFKLQASNNAFPDNVGYNIPENPDAIWVDITGSDYTVTDDGDYFWNVSDVYYRAVRVVYDQVSGTATGTILIFAKGIV